jgi:hypothetical protein
MNHTAIAAQPLGGILLIFAYLEPAAGGMIIQTLIAAAVALPFILRSRITRGLNRLRGRTEAPSMEQSPPKDD